MVVRLRVYVYSMQIAYTSTSMRTNIEIDDALLEEAMAATGHSTKKATVEEALRRVVAAHRRRQAIDELAGIGWDGDLEAMRSDKHRRRA